MLLLKCGEEGSADVNVSAEYNEALHVFDFGMLSASDGLLATVYAVCWCQTNHEMGYHCDSAAETLAWFDHDRARVSRAAVTKMGSI